MIQIMIMLIFIIEETGGSTPRNMSILSPSVKEMDLQSVIFQPEVGLHSILYTLHYTLYTLHSTLYTLHSTLNIFYRQR